MTRRKLTERQRESEDDFLSWVIELANLRRWVVAHFRPARIVKNGLITYRTAVSADGRGFPDLVLVRGHRVIFAELKAEKGKASREQINWLSLLAETKAEVYTWRPVDRSEIERVLL